MFVIGDELFTQRAVPVAGAVFEDRAVDMFQGVEPYLRGRKVGLSDIQMVYLDARARAASARGTSLRIGEAGISSARCEMAGMGIGFIRVLPRA